MIYIRSTVAKLLGTNAKDGRDGLVGAPGPVGPPGENGKDGKEGKDGQNGRDGQSGAAGPPGMRPYAEDQYMLFKRPFHSHSLNKRISNRRAGAR